MEPVTPTEPTAFESVPTHLKQLIGTFRQLPPFRGRVVATVPTPFRPFGVAVAECTNELVVLDFDNDGVHVFAPDGTWVRQWGSQGNGPGQFHGPTALAITKAGEVVVVDYANHRVQVFRLDGTFLRAWGSEGSGNRQFYGPMNVVLVRETQVMVMDYDCVRVFQLADGAFVRKWSLRRADPREYVVAACATPEGGVLVADNVNHRVQMLTPEGVVVRRWGVVGLGRGQFAGLSGIEMRHRHVFVTDRDNHCVVVFSVDGTAVGAAHGSKGSEQGQFMYPAGLAVTRQGTVVVADRGNRRLQLWQ